MKLQEQLRQDLKASMKAKNESKTSALRVLIGEFGRQTKKELEDIEILSIIKKLIKAEEETMAKSGQKESDFIAALAGYLPKQAGEDEIKEWIEQNIDFSEFKNKMQAMRPIMTHFAGNADGNTVKRILDGM